jgi:zinc protease
MPDQTSAASAFGPDVFHTMLENGLEVVVIPDHRSPVVTHMLWYKNGGADDPRGKSGIAHFLEHLMFKGTEAHPEGEFSRTVTDLGGEENAFTSLDYTAYFQRISKEHLGRMMEFEADRMNGLVLTDAVVDPERNVVLEERRMHVENDPARQLNEAIGANLNVHHPYGTPVIGWEHEIETLDRHDALAYYGRFYTPENAILIVAGDVAGDEVVALAGRTYGKIARRAAPPVRQRPQEPPPRVARLLRLADPKVEQPFVQRVYLVPSYRTGKPGEGEALDVLARMLGAPITGVLYKELVVARELAVNAGAWYWGEAMDQSRFGIHAVPRQGIELPALEAALDEVLAGFAAAQPAAADLARAKTRLVAEAVYAQDSQAMLAQAYGTTLAIGGSIADVREWPARIEQVTAEEVQGVARRYLEKRRSVTGYLETMPESEAA